MAGRVADCFSLPLDWIRALSGGNGRDGLTTRATEQKCPFTNFGERALRCAPSGIRTPDPLYKR